MLTTWFSLLPIILVAGDRDWQHFVPLPTRLARSLHWIINNIFFHSLSLIPAHNPFQFLKSYPDSERQWLGVIRLWSKAVSGLKQSHPVTSRVVSGQEHQSSLPLSCLQNGDNWDTDIKGLLWGSNEIMHETLLDPISSIWPNIYTSNKHSLLCEEAP